MYIYIHCIYIYSIYSIYIVPTPPRSGIRRRSLVPPHSYTHVRNSPSVCGCISIQRYWFSLRDSFLMTLSHPRELVLDPPRFGIRRRTHFRPHSCCSVHVAAAEIRSNRRRHPCARGVATGERASAHTGACEWIYLTDR